MDRLDILRLARAAGLPPEAVWGVVRTVLPVPRPRLILSGELLGACQQPAADEAATGSR